MITALFFTIVGFLIVFFKTKQNIDDTFSVVVLGLVGALGGLMVGCLVAAAIPADIQKNVQEYRLESLRDNSALNGSFFLGSGYINERPVYSCYIQSGEYYDLFTIDALNASIQYTDGVPVLKKYTERLSGYWLNSFALIPPREPSYVFCVPRGSIVNSYALDAQ